MNAMSFKTKFILILANAFVWANVSWAIPSIPPGGSFSTSTIYEGTTASGGASPVLKTGDSIVGVGVVDNIKNADNQVIWRDGDGGEYLNFYFENYTATSISPSGTTPILIDFTGGTLDMYASSQSIAGSGINGGHFDTDKANIINSATGGVFLSLVGAAGGIEGDPSATLQASISGGTLGKITSGSGLGFLDVNPAGGGSQAGNIGKGAVEGFDVALNSSFNAFPPTGGYALSGSLNLKTGSVPEPNSLALFGMGLVGFAVSSLRRKKI